MLIWTSLYKSYSIIKYNYFFPLLFYIGIRIIVAINYQFIVCCRLSKYIDNKGEIMRQGAGKVQGYIPGSVWRAHSCSESPITCSVLWLWILYPSLGLSFLIAPSFRVGGGRIMEEMKNRLINISLL